MNLLIVAPEQIPVPPILGGSVEITILAIAKRLAKRHRVTIVSRAHSRYPRYSFVDGIHVYRVPTGSPSTYVANVIRFLRGHSFDWIQVDNRPKFVSKLREHFPNANISLFLHSLTFVSKPYASKEQASRGLRKADVIIANSSSLKAQLTRRFPDSGSKIRKVWLGVDTSRFHPSEHSLSSSPFRILFAGRLIPRKGLPVLLRAAKLVRNRTSRPVKVIVAGGAQQSGYTLKMKSLAKHLGVRTEFLGTVPHRRIHRVFRNAHVFVCPSQKHEAFGLVNVEAMASGIPVIASDIGGIKEIVKHNRNGYLVRNYKNATPFANAIKKLMDNKSLYRSMKKNARQSALSKFSWEATAGRLERIYQ